MDMGNLALGVIMSVFISYRRSASQYLARSVFQGLQARGFDVFLDVTAIDNGAFDSIILNQIAALPHFLLVLSPGSLERCAVEGDWLRLEIEEAFHLKRNIVPLYDEGFNIDEERRFLPEPLATNLARLNAPPYSHYYFDAFLDTISDRFLKAAPLDILITPTPKQEQTEVQRRIAQASQQKPTSIPPADTHDLRKAKEASDTNDAPKRSRLLVILPLLAYIVVFIVAAVIDNQYLQRELLYRAFLDGFIVYSVFALPVAFVLWFILYFRQRSRR